MGKVPTFIFFFFFFVRIFVTLSIGTTHFEATVPLLWGAKDYPMQLFQYSEQLAKWQLT
jgi:hypothetical protein